MQVEKTGEEVVDGASSMRAQYWDYFIYCMAVSKYTNTWYHLMF